jgi:tripartite-type tricarboxylate transporter receptor subunit TctC
MFRSMPSPHRHDNGGQRQEPEATGGRQIREELMKKLISAMVATAAFAVLPFAAAAQSYPDHAITLVVPFSAGGPTDTVTRLIAEPMKKALGQDIVVQNVTGAGGTVAAGQVAKAPADGYTVLIHHIGMSTAPSLYKALPYDPLKDFATVGLVTEVPMTIVGRKDLEAKTLKELIDYIKKDPEKVTMANAGIGAASQLCGMLFMEAIGAKVTTVPYQGTGPALTDLVGGQVDIMCDQTTNTTGQILGGEIKAFAVTAEQRLANLPDVPTTAEAGLPDFQLRIWHGLYVPTGTPEEAIKKLTGALQTALKDQNVIDRFAELGTTPVSQERATPEAHTETLSSQIALWAPIIKAAGVGAK